MVMKRIYVIGSGTGEYGQLSIRAGKILFSGMPVYFRTSRHAAGSLLRKLGGSRLHTFDHLYEQGETFDQVYKTILKTLINGVNRRRRICYCVPGHPSAGEEVVKMLKKVCPGFGIKLIIVGGQSFLLPLLDLLNVDLLDGVSIHDALAIERLKEPSRDHLLIAQVYNRQRASAVKLKLLELYPPDYPVKVVSGAGTAQQTLCQLSLKELDHQPIYNHLTSLYLPPAPGYGLGGLMEIMARLRSENGCPWDMDQTNSSLRQYLVEEAFEVIAAIDQGDDQALEEELGDLLLQVVFHSQIAREQNRFDLYGVIDKISAKLIRRHPHVFGPENAENASQVRQRWEEIKAGENNSGAKDALAVDYALPALLRAFKVQKKAAEKGFDWPALEGPLDKIREELAELEEAWKSGHKEAVEEEFGDYLFSAVNLARFLKINPELALGKTVHKFLTRFDYILEQAGKEGRPVESYNLDQLDQWWEEAKKIRKLGNKSRNRHGKSE